MDDLVEEPALLVATRVESVEHVIDSRRQTPELVVTGIEVDAFVRFAAVDPLHDVGDLVDGLEHLPRDEPRERRCGHERRGHRGEHPADAVAPSPIRRRPRVARGDLHERDAIPDLLDPGDGHRLGLVAQPSAEEEPEEADERGRHERQRGHAEGQPPAQRAPTLRHAARSR